MKKILFLLLLLPTLIFGQNRRYYGGNYRNYYRGSYWAAPYISPRVYYVLPSDINRITRDFYYRNRYNYYRPYTLYGDWRYRSYENPSCDQKGELDMHEDKD